VIREGSLTAASAYLRAPKSTLSKRLSDLEAQLGVRLIERSTRHLRITQEGEVLAARVDRLLGEADDIRRAFGEADGAARGHIRLAVPPVLGTIMMGPLAAEFRRRYPDVTLEIHFLDRSPDLLEEGFDGCIRFGPLEDSAQVARLLIHGQAVLAAAPDLPGLDRLKRPEQLPDFPLIGLTAPWPGGWPLVSEAEAVEIPVEPALRLGSHLAVRDAMLAGAGIAPLPRIIAAPEFAAGRLIRVLPEWTTPRKGLYFVYPSAQSVTARLRAFIDFLSENLKEID
ncbi:MAG: LysR substrate-binding domain-containing protein, partial [Paracoccaceae bacterium]